MKLKTFGFAALAAVLTGCGGAEDTTEACRYAVAMAIDRGEYDTALTKIDSAACQGAYTAEERNLTLGAIYVGKAGYNVPTIVNEMTKVNQATTNSYQSFVDAFARQATGAGLSNLNTAVGYYRAMLGNNTNLGQYCTANQASLTVLQKDACFYSGLVEAAASATSLSLIFGSDVNLWTNPGGCAEAGGNDTNSNGIADEAEATACAIQYATGSACNAGLSAVSLGNKSFVTTSGSGTFDQIKITVNANSCTAPNVYYKPIQGTPPSASPVVTDGLCTADAGTYLACTSVSEPANCFPCPVVSGSGGMTVEQTIVDAINNGSSAIAASVGSTSQTNVEQSINDFKTEACGTDGVCTQADIAAYLNQ